MTPMRPFLVLVPLALLMAAACDPAVSREPAPPPSEAQLLRTFIDEFVPITPGTGRFPRSFEMGSRQTGQEQPVHTVTFTEQFSIARYEVPQNLYEVVMGANPSRWKGPRNAAERMSWAEANEFCRRVTEKLRSASLIGRDEIIRLPTEAEWEYCCRAGTTTAYSFGDRATAAGDQEPRASLLDPYAWHTGNAAGNDPPVGALKPNPWDLYDMHGYLWEFTLDDWHDSYDGAPTDGSAWTSPDRAGDDPALKRIVIRGGSWKDAYPLLRSAARRPFPVDARDDAVGFRCVLCKVRVTP